MGPPGLTATPSDRRSSQAVTRDTLIRETRALFADCGIHKSQSWVSTLVGRYRRSPMRGLPFGQFLAARVQLTTEERTRLHLHPDYRRVISYVDSVGEDASRNVDRARGWRY
jgi:hypothetical protein